MTCRRHCSSRRWSSEVSPGKQPAAVYRRAAAAAEPSSWAGREQWAWGVAVLGSGWVFDRKNPTRFLNPPTLPTQRARSWEHLPRQHLELATRTAKKKKKTTFPRVPSDVQRRQLVHLTAVWRSTGGGGGGAPGLLVKVSRDSPRLSRCGRHTHGCCQRTFAARYGAVSLVDLPQHRGLSLGGVRGRWTSIPGVTVDSCSIHTPGFVGNSYSD